MLNDSSVILNLRFFIFIFPILSVGENDDNDRFLPGCSWDVPTVDQIQGTNYLVMLSVLVKRRLQNQNKYKINLDQTHRRREVRFRWNKAVKSEPSPWKVEYFQTLVGPNLLSASGFQRWSSSQLYSPFINFFLPNVHFWYYVTLKPPTRVKLQIRNKFKVVLFNQFTKMNISTMSLILWGHKFWCGSVGGGGGGWN